jgi:hypothetical protein
MMDNRSVVTASGWEADIRLLQSSGKFSLVRGPDRVFSEGRTHQAGTAPANRSATAFIDRKKEPGSTLA